MAANGEGEPKLDGFVILYSPSAASRQREVNDAVIKRFPLYGVPFSSIGNKGISITNLTINEKTSALLPALAAAFGRVYLPESMVPENQRNESEVLYAISDGFRTCAIMPDKTLSDKVGVAQDGFSEWSIAIPIYLKDLGVAGKDEELIDVPTLSVKGVGTVFDGLTPEDEAVFSLVDDQQGQESKLRRFISYLAPLGPVIVPRLLQDDLRDVRAVGGEGFLSIRDSIGVTQQLIEDRVDLKFFPVIYGVTLPSFAIREMLRHARNAGIERNYGKRLWSKKHNTTLSGGGAEDLFKLAQSVRLSFSQVRARGFTEEEFDIQAMTYRFEALRFTPQEYREVIAPRYRRDFRRMFDAYTRFYETDNDDQYHHVDFGEVKHLLEMDESEFRNYNIAYYFTKDLALAKTGAYLADLDALTIREEVTKNQLPFITRRFTGELFKEWIRLMTNLRIASHAAEGNPVSENAYGKIEQEEYRLLLAELGNSSTSTVTETDDALVFYIKYLDKDKQSTVSGFDVVVEKALLHMRFQTPDDKEN